MTIPTEGNEFRQELEISVKEELTVAESSPQAEESGGPPSVEWLLDPDAERYEVSLRTLLGAVEAVEDETPRTSQFTASSRKDGGMGEREGWRSHAACRHTDPELFFPEGTAGPALAAASLAKRVCGTCPVQARCLNWALDHGAAFGIWGGLAEDERRRLRRALAEAN